MTAQEWKQYFEERIPAALSMDWDNDGAMLLPDPDREIERVLIALDVTPEVIVRAIEGGFDLILTHHPYIFRPLRRIESKGMVSLLRAGIAVFSYHTRLDALIGGVNDALAARLGLSDITSFGEGDMGRIGMLDCAYAPREFAAYLRERLGASRISAVIGTKPIRRVALLGGAGKDFIPDAISAYADAFVTGEAGYNALTDLAGGEMSVYLAGHYHTEQPVCTALADMIGAESPNTRVEVMDSLVIEEL